MRFRLSVDNNQRLTRDRTVEPVLRDQILGASGDREILISPLHDHEQVGNRLICSTYIQIYIHNIQ